LPIALLGGPIYRYEYVSGEYVISEWLIDEPIASNLDLVANYEHLPDGGTDPASPGGGSGGTDPDSPGGGSGEGGSGNQDGETGSGDNSGNGDGGEKFGWGFGGFKDFGKKLGLFFKDPLGNLKELFSDPDSCLNGLKTLASLFLAFFIIYIPFRIYRLFRKPKTGRKKKR
jgi:hypothetical protein